MNKVAILIFFIVLGAVAGSWYQWWRHQSPSIITPTSPLSELLNQQPSFIASPIPTPQPVTILFGGDLMFDRDIRLKMQKHGPDFVLEPLTELFTSYDVVAANLEGPVTTNPSRSLGSAPGSTNNFIFTFDPSILPMLTKNNLRILNVGNNHIGNFGTDGIRQTKTLLTEANLDFFGNTGIEKTPQERILLKEIGSHTLAFVNSNQFVSDGYQTALEDLAVATQSADLVIVMTHWGNEYEPTAKGVIVNQAHTLIDRGADLIIGSHPHVVQQHEDYQGKRIYYSLGNFVFDQYFSAETTQGLLVGVTIQPDGQMSYEEIPIVLDKNGQTKLLK
jgi:poly-gamma-glutamate synthesis protein (capsule biosynthesis protein)